jgi:hypothetical protein
MVRVLHSSIIIVGEKDSVTRAKLLMDVHLGHQSRLWKGPSAGSCGAPTNRSSKISFSIPEDIVGLVIGKGGSNIATVSRKHNVDVRISAKSDEPERMVSIVGPSESAVKQAKDDLFGDKGLFKIEDSNIVGLVLGKRKANLIDISKKAGLYRAQFHEATNDIELIGTKSAIETAHLLLESHLEYFKNAASGGGKQKQTERYNKSYGA